MDKNKLRIKYLYVIKKKLILDGKQSFKSLNIILKII